MNQKEALAAVVRSRDRHRTASREVSVLAEKLRLAMLACIEAGCTQTEVARALGVSHQFVQKSLSKVATGG